MDRKAKSIDEYLSNVEPQHRAELERIRAFVKQLVPSVEETMSYGMPTLPSTGVFYCLKESHELLSFLFGNRGTKGQAKRLQDYEACDPIYIGEPTA